MSKDYKVIDMPSMMARLATTPAPHNAEKWVRDDSWYSQIRDIYSNLLDFFDRNNLVKNNIDRRCIDNVVVMFSDLTEEGQALVESGADDRWLASFDRPGSAKLPTDVSSLEKALRKIKGLLPSG